MPTRQLPDFDLIIDQLGIDDHDALRSYLKPGMYACWQDDSTEHPLGACRFGGLPDLPVDLAWPQCDIGSIPFVAQINLAELPASPGRELLPAQGMLYFFYGTPDGELVFPNEYDGTGGVMVLFAENLEEIKRAELPTDLDEECGVMEAMQRLQFHGCSTFVDAEHPVWLRYGRDFGPQLPELKTPWGDQRVLFQILGHPQPMQTSVCRYVLDNPLSDDPTELQAQIDWTLGLETLFQATDAIGDCSLYFMMHRDDLLARRWDRFRWTLQCT